MHMYRNHPVLVRHGAATESRGQLPAIKTWPVQYARMFDMTNDSHHFCKKVELHDQGFSVAPLGHWSKGHEVAVPLYEGKMVQAFDHRAADVIVNLGNLKRAAQPESLTAVEKQAADRYPVPQYWIRRRSMSAATSRHTAWPTSQSLRRATCER